MATVRQIVQDLVDGMTGVEVAVMRLEQHNDWDLGVEPTQAQRWGADDAPPAGENSPDQIDLVGHALTRNTRGRLWAAASHGMQ